MKFLLRACEGGHSLRGISRKRGVGGFTIVEVLGVLFILGALMFLAIPPLQRSNVKAKANLETQNLKMIEAAKRQFEADFPGMSITYEHQLTKYFPDRRWPESPWGLNYANYEGAMDLGKTVKSPFNGRPEYEPPAGGKLLDANGFNDLGSGGYVIYTPVSAPSPPWGLPSATPVNPVLPPPSSPSFPGPPPVFPSPFPSTPTPTPSPAYVPLPLPTPTPVPTRVPVLPPLPPPPPPPAPISPSFVALVFQSNYVYHSSDGVSWTRSSLLPTSSQYWSEVVYGAGKFVALASGTNKAFYSTTNGATWQETSLPVYGDNSNWENLAYGGGVFVAIKRASNRGAYSIDGVAWRELVLPSSKDWHSLAYEDGRFVVLASGANSHMGAYSTDGMTWKEMPLPAARTWWAIGSGDGKFVTLGMNSNKGAISTNGVNWTEITLPRSQEWRDVSYGNGAFVAVASGPTNKGAYSRDGTTWTEVTLPAFRSWRTITYKNGKFVALAWGSDRGAYSIDGVTWTEMTLPVSASWGAIY